MKNNIRAVILKLADRIANLEFSKNVQTETSLFEMYKREYPVFKKELKCDPFNTDDPSLKQPWTCMWIYLDSLFYEKKKA